MKQKDKSSLMKTSKMCFGVWNSHWDEQKWSKLWTVENLAKESTSVFKDAVYV